MPGPEEIPQITEISQPPSPEQVKPVESEEELRSRLDQSLKDVWQDALHTQSFERASGTLAELKELRSWRSAASRSRFGEFYNFFEQVSQLNKVPLTSFEDRAAMRQVLVEDLASKAPGLSPRVADLYMGLLAQAEGLSYAPKFEMTETKLKELGESGDLNILTDPSVPFDIKLNRIQTRFEGDLLGRRSLDRREQAQKKEEGEQSREESPPIPPPDSDESKPSMDEMERSPEGEVPPAIWTIMPPWGGYYKAQSFDTFDAGTNTWRQSHYDYAPRVDVPPQIMDSVSLFASVSPNEWTRVPVPYTHVLKEVEAVGVGHVEIVQDQNGDSRIRAVGKGDEMVEIKVILLPTEETRILPIPQEVGQFGSILSEETKQKVEEIRVKKTGNLAQARAMSRYVMTRLTYSNDSSFNEIYDTHPAGYIGAIDEHKQADCDVANTYFAALCAELDIPVRHVVGHMVKGKDLQGAARITSGTGHAWAEVWDDITNHWVRIDATPPGDPQLDEEEEKGSEGIPGDYGSQEAIGPTDEQLRELEEKLREHAEELSYSKEERELAELTSIELTEARDIMREINAAEETKLPNGERIVDVLSKLFSLIVESRRTQVKDYTGPLRRREGGDNIEDIVAHKIGIVGGDPDPASRQKDIEKQHEEKKFGGFDLYFIGDKSGSMSETVDGEEKWKLQRRAQYLVLSSLNRFEQNLQTAGVHLADPLSVRTEALSFRDKNQIDIDKPLSNEFAAEDKVRLWRSLGNQGSGNGDTAALSIVHNQISDERRLAEEAGNEDDRLRIVMPCSDGMPDDVSSVHQYAERLGKMNTVVVGIGLTETATQVPRIFDTPYSRGDIARDLNDLPMIVAKHVILEAMRLFPEQSQASLKPYLDTVIAKFRTPEVE
jgi:hypothetical protein